MHGRPRVAHKRSRRESQCGEQVAAALNESPSEAANQTPGIWRQQNGLRETKNAVDRADSNIGGAQKGARRFLRKVMSSGGVDDQRGVRAFIDQRAILGDAERTAAVQSSEEFSIPSLEISRKSTLCRNGDGDGYHGDTSSRAKHHALHGVSPPRIMAGDSDAIFELSTESSTSASSDGNNGCWRCHQRSKEPPSALLMAPPFVEDDHAVNTRQGRTRRSEIKPASPRWKHAASDVDVADDAARIPVAATKWGSLSQGSLSPVRKAPRDSIVKSLLPVSAAASEILFDAPSKKGDAAPSSRCTRRREVGALCMLDSVDANDHMLDTMNANKHVLEIGSAERSPLVSHNSFDEKRERCRRLLEEVVSLKEKLRKAEIRQAAAEATASSVLQRAKAAELSREVKEIQVRWLLTDNTPRRLSCQGVYVVRREISSQSCATRS